MIVKCVGTCGWCDAQQPTRSQVRRGKNFHLVHQCCYPADNPVKSRLPSDCGFPQTLHTFPTDLSLGIRALDTTYKLSVD